MRALVSADAMRLRHDPSGEGLNSLKLVLGKEFRFAADGEPVCYDFPGLVIPRG